MGPVRQNPIQTTVRSVHVCVCITLCTTVAHNIAQNRPDNFPYYPPDNHHCSDDVYLTEGGWLLEAVLHALLYSAVLRSSMFSYTCQFVFTAFACNKKLVLLPLVHKNRCMTLPDSKQVEKQVQPFSLGLRAYQTEWQQHILCMHII